ncbi:hypothetical protein Tco_0273939 [Tanacetum coccineum]
MADADHLSDLRTFIKTTQEKEITKTFPLENPWIGLLFVVDCTPWFADFANYHAGNFIVKGMSSQQKTSFSKMSNTTSGMTPSCSKSVRINRIGGVWCTAKEALDILEACHIIDPPGDIHGLQSSPPKRKNFTRDEMLQNSSKFVKFFDVWGIDFMGNPSVFLEATNTIPRGGFDYLSKMGEAKGAPPNGRRVVCPGFLKPLVLAVFVLRSQELHNPQLHLG